MWRFRIDALADPQALPRIVDQFAQRSIVPSSVAAELQGERMRCEVAVAQLAHAQAEIVAAKLRTIVLVASVLVDREAVIGVDNTRHASDVSDQAA